LIRDLPYPMRRLVLFACGGVALTALVSIAVAQTSKPTSSTPITTRQYRQVTVFGIAASPNDMTVDPKLAKVENQLRRFRPNHGFKLRGVTSERLGPEHSLTCDMGNGYSATTQLVTINANGKIRFKVELVINGRTEFTTFVTTPPNQIFFCEKKLTNGERLLIGIGAR
jgi:hypothetical protein